MSTPNEQATEGGPSDAGVILIVDDEPVMRTMVQAMVRRLGYRPRLAADGQEGLEAYLAHRSEIDLVLLDMVMPRMDGRGCFRAIRAANPEAKVILCSGFSRDPGVSELMDEGLCEFLSKPFSIQELDQVLQTALATGPG